VHRVAITSILLAAKFFDDAYYNNSYYAKVGGVLVSEMNRLEVEFLFRINFSLHVSPDLYNKYHAELSAYAVRDNATKSPTVFAQAAGSSDDNANVPLLSFNNVEKNLQTSSTTFPVQNCNHHGESRHISTQPYQETKRYVAGVPMQITPSPTPPPQVRNKAIPPQNQYYTYPSTNDLHINDAWSKKSSMGFVNQSNDFIINEPDNLSSVSRGGVEVNFPITVIHRNCPVLPQPKRRNPWVRRSDISNSPQRGSNILHQDKVIFPPHIQPACNISTAYSGKAPPIYFEYTNYCENNSGVLPHPHSDVLINDHNLIHYQPHTASTVVAGTVDHNRSW